MPAALRLAGVDTKEHIVAAVVRILSEMVCVQLPDIVVRHTVTVSLKNWIKSSARRGPAGREIEVMAFVQMERAALR